MTDIEFREVVDGGMKISEVFYRDDFVGAVFQYEEEPTWYYRTPYNLMWWRSTDKDSAAKELLKIKGIN